MSMVFPPLLSPVQVVSRCHPAAAEYLMCQVDCAFRPQTMVTEGFSVSQSGLCIDHNGHLLHTHADNNSTNELHEQNK